jgi:hypothetical protein
LYVPKALSPDDPNLLIAADRLRRILRTWAVLFAFVGIITLSVGIRSHPTASLPWLISALLLATGEQPAFLALAAVQWGLSLIVLIPGTADVFGLDLISFIIESGSIERIASAVIRLVLMITLWNQFLFYRMLYGTADLGDFDEQLPALPEIIRNRSDTMAWMARLVGLVGILMSISAIPLRRSVWAGHTLGLSFTLGMFAMGLGIGAAFSPTEHRSVALTGLGLGGLAFMGTLIIARGIAL